MRLTGAERAAFAVPRLSLPPVEPPCRGDERDAWFAAEAALIQHAKTECGRCGHRSSCLDGAIERREPWGVWGGELIENGRIIAQRRPRGRPRKERPAAT